jgi:hypothetical protein
MSQDQGNSASEKPQSRLSATLRTIIALALVALGILGVLLALDIIPLAEFGRAAAKVLLIAVVVGLTSIGLGLLLR